MEIVTIDKVVEFIRAEVQELIKDVKGRRSCIILLARNMETDSESMQIETDFIKLSKQVPNSNLPELLHSFSNNIEPYKAPPNSLLFLGFNTFWKDSKSGAAGLADIVAMVTQLGEVVVLLFKEDIDGAQMQMFVTLEEFWQVFRLSPEKDDEDDNIIWN